MPSPQTSRQSLLFPAQRRKVRRVTNARKRDLFSEQNHQAAEIILGDPARYGGSGSLPVIWAELVSKGRG